MSNPSFTHAAAAVAAAAALLLLAACDSGLRKSPEQVITEYYGAISSGDAEALLKLLDFSKMNENEAAGIKNGLSGELAGAKLALQEKGGIAGTDFFYSVDPAEVQEGREMEVQTVIYFQYNFNPRQTVSHYLINTDEGWKLTYSPLAQN